ncbi:MAG: FG-GAP repeat protein [Ferruginibacter sp.]
MKKNILLTCFMAAAYYFSFSQNVGIGTTTPAEKLHVAGNIKADTLKPTALKLIPNAGAGKVLTSDFAGNANWQTNNATAAGNVGFGVWGDCATNGNISEYNPVVDETTAGSTNFGVSVSISGDFAIVGSPGDFVGAGSISIYQYDGTNWVFMQKITDATGSGPAKFGCSVSISGNYAIAGSFSDKIGANSLQGSASIYKYNGSSWVLMQKLTESTGAAGDYFGLSVSISGNYAIVGVPFDDKVVPSNGGSAIIYQTDGISWTQLQKMVDITGAANDNFGYSVSISATYAIVGASSDDVGANVGQGSARIFQRIGQIFFGMQQIVDGTGAAGDNFGTRVSISGDYAIVGAPYDDIGANADQGSASIYKYNGTNWVMMEKKTDGTGGAGDNFGYSVSISGSNAIVGAWGHDVGTNVGQGSACIFQRIGYGWQRLQYVADPGGNPNDSFGYSTTIDGATKRFLNGAIGYAGGRGKVVFGKIN